MTTTHREVSERHDALLNALTPDALAPSGQGRPDIEANAKAKATKENKNDV